MKNLGVILLKGILKLFAAIPLRAAYALSGVLEFLLKSVVRYRRDVVMANLARCFPEKRYNELSNICNEFYKHFTELLVETIWFGGCDKERFQKSNIVQVTNIDCAQTLIENSPSVMVMFAHTGNWEIIGGLEAFNLENGENTFNSENTTVVYRELSNKAWNEVMKANRFAPVDNKDYESCYIESKNIMRFVVRNRDKKRFYFLNTDQRPYFKGSDNIKVNFMGQECRSMSGAAALAHKLNMAVCYMSMKRERRGHYSIEFIPICEDASKMEIQAIMDKYYSLVEADIRQEPENYLWSHKRWQ